MKSKHLFFSLLAFAMLVMSSCSEKDTDYAERFIGEYNITLTPNLVATIDMGQIPITFEKITTTCNIVKEDDKGNVKIVIEPINGVIGRIELEAFCDGLGMHIEDYSYNGSIAINEIDKINCNIKLKGSTVSYTSTKTYSWNSSVTGKATLNYSGIDQSCDITGNIEFYATISTVNNI